MDPEVPLLGLAAVPIIAALLQVVKSAMPAERFNGWFPAIALVLGVGWNVLASLSLEDGVTASAALMGVVIGLAASGLYSQTKTALGK